MERLAVDREELESIRCTDSRSTWTSRSLRAAAPAARPRTGAAMTEPRPAPACIRG